MGDLNKKIPMIAAIVAGVLGIVPTLLIFGAEDDAAAAGPVGYAINLTLVIFVVGIVLALFATFRNISVNPAGMKKSLIGLAGFAVLIILSFVFADGSDFERYKSDEATTMYVSAGLTLFWLMSFVTLGSLAYSVISRAIK